MNNLDHTYWFEIARNLFILTAATVGLAFLATRWIRSAAWQRNIWQIAFVSVGILSLSEISGLTKGVALWFGGKKPEPRKFTVRTFAPTAPAIPLPEKSFSFPPEQPANLPTIHQDTSVIWPGLVWVIGVAVILSRVLFSQTLLLGFRLRRRKLSEDEVVEAVGRLAERLDLSRNVVLRQSPALRSPIAFGIFRKTIVVPENFSKMFTPAQRDAVLAHELAHLAFNDPFWYLVADFVAALFWWNPLVWLARTRLHSTSEDAADEASLLVNDGATTLAECLVHLAKQFASTGAFGWTSIEGNGYRSNLALRVQRLLALENSEWRAPRRTTVVALKVCTPVLLATLVIISSAVAQRDKTQPSNLNSAIHQAWNDSVGALALNSVAPANDPATVDQAVTPIRAVPAPIKTNNVPAITKQKVQFTDKYDPVAEAAANAAAAAAAAGLPVHTTNTHALTEPTSSGRQKIRTKLESIRLEQFSNDGLPLGILLQQLVQRSLDLDSAHVGINFMIDSAGTGSPHALETMIVPPFHLRDVNISGVLGAIATASKDTIRYRIEDYAVVVTTNLPVAPQLLTRVFRIEPYSFTEALKSAGFVTAEPPPKSSATNWTQALNLATLKYFSAAGINMDPPKYLFLNDRVGTLLVRAYKQDLEIVTTAIESLNAAPAQVTIEAKFTEITDDDSRALGFDWFIKNGVRASGTNSFGINLKSNTNTPTVRVGDFTVTNAAGVTITGILNDAQFRTILRALETRPGVDVLTAPRVTTLSGRQAQISSLDLVTVVNGISSVKRIDGTETNNLSTTVLPFGPSLDVIPHVSADGFSLRMQLVATVNEFLGYDTPNQELQKAANQTFKSLQPKLPLPRFRSRQVSTVAHVWDGQTIVLGGLVSEEIHKMKDKVPVLGGIPLVGKLFQSESTSSVKKNLIIFITPTVIDPAGNRVHNDKEMQPLLQKHPPAFQAPPATSASSGMIQLKLN